MEIKIANKNYTLYFGWDFLDRINHEFGIVVESAGQEINTRTGGLAFLEVGLSSYDPIAVQKAIQAATNTETSKPSVVNIRKVIEEMVQEPKEYKAFVDEMLAEIKKAPLLKAVANLANH